MAHVVVPNFSKLVAARPITVPPIGAFNAAAVSEGLGNLTNTLVNNTSQKNQLLSVAQAIAPSDPNTASIIEAQANSINPFSTSKNNAIQQIEPLLSLAQSKAYHDAELGLQKQEFAERQKVDAANIAFKNAEEARINAALNAPPVTLGPVGSVTVSGQSTTPAFYPSGVDSDASQTASATGGPGVLPALPGSVSMQSGAIAGPTAQSKTYGPQADPKALMNQALDLYDDSFANHQKMYGKSPSESLETADAADAEYASADQINQMQGRIEQLYGSTDREKANPQNAPSNPKAPKDPYAWENIPEDGMATKVLAPDLAVRRRKSAGNMIEQDIEIKNGKQFVGPDRVIKPATSNKEQQLYTQPLPDGTVAAHIVYPDGHVDNIHGLTQSPNANQLTIQRGVSDDGKKVAYVANYKNHSAISWDTEYKDKASASRELSKQDDALAKLKREAQDNPDDEALAEQIAKKASYVEALRANLRELDPASKALPDNKPDAVAVPAEPLTDRLNKLKGLLK